MREREEELDDVITHLSEQLKKKLFLGNFQKKKFIYFNFCNK